MTRDSAAQHNAALRVRLLQCGIRLSRELSGEEPEVHRLSRHASTAAARARTRPAPCCGRCNGGCACNGSLTTAQDMGSARCGQARRRSCTCRFCVPCLDTRARRRRRIAEWSSRERAPPHDSVCVPLRCVPCSRAGQQVRDGFGVPRPAIRALWAQRLRLRGLEKARLAALLPRGERMGHGEL